MQEFKRPPQLRHSRRATGASLHSVQTLDGDSPSSNEQKQKLHNCRLHIHLLVVSEEQRQEVASVFGALKPCATVVFCRVETKGLIGSASTRMRDWGDSGLSRSFGAHRGLLGIPSLSRLNPHDFRGFRFSACFSTGRSWPLQVLTHLQTCAGFRKAWLGRGCKTGDNANCFIRVQDPGLIEAQHCEVVVLLRLCCYSNDLDALHGCIATQTVSCEDHQASAEIKHGRHKPPYWFEIPAAAITRSFLDFRDNAHHQL